MTCAGLRNVLRDPHQRLPRVQAGPERHEVVGGNANDDRLTVSLDGRPRTVARYLADLPFDAPKNQYRTLVGFVVEFEKRVVGHGVTGR